MTTTPQNINVLMGDQSMPYRITYKVGRNEQGKIVEIQQIVFRVATPAGSPDEHVTVHNTAGHLPGVVHYVFMDSKSETVTRINLTFRFNQSGVSQGKVVSKTESEKRRGPQYENLVTILEGYSQEYLPQTKKLKTSGAYAKALLQLQAMPPMVSCSISSERTTTTVQTKKNGTCSSVTTTTVQKKNKDGSYSSVTTTTVQTKKKNGTCSYVTTTTVQKKNKDGSYSYETTTTVRKKNKDGTICKKV